MPVTLSALQRLARRVGGARVLALPMLRALAVVAGFLWLLLAPAEFQRLAGVAGVLVAFLVYSVVVMGCLWRWPGRTLKLNFVVLLVDLAFALALIRLTGGAQSVLFLALLLIAGLQSYYYGMRRGVLVALGSAAAYVALAWPTLDHAEVANTAIRVTILVGTAVGVGVLADVEERERLEIGTLTVAAQERERFIQGVVESLREGVVALDRAGRIVAFNRAMEAQSGLVAADVMGRPFLEVFPGYRHESLQDPLDALLRGETEGFTLEAVEHEFGIAGSDGGRGRAIQNLKGSLLRQRGEPAGAVLLIQDVTERVAFERAARQAEKLAALGTMAAGLAHELNNPIGIISSRIEIMLLDAESQPIRGQLGEDLQVLYRHAQRVARIAQGLLSFSRQPSERRGPVDLNHLVDETLLLVEKPITKQGVTITRRLAPDLPPVWGDSNTLQQVVLNLLTNARDAIHGPGEIVIETACLEGGGESVRLLVRDTGPGIPPEALPRIFDPFFTTKEEGTGLGLSISYGIVRDHQGTVDVQSRPGEGTCFILTFPAHPRPGAAVGDQA